MEDQILFLPGSISIMSKLKEPTSPLNQQHSLSKIIREQAVNYEQQLATIQQKPKDIREPQQKRKRNPKKQQQNPINFLNPQLNPKISNGQFERRDNKSRETREKKQQKSKEEAQNNRQYLQTNKKVNLLIFDEGEKMDNKHNINSKKQKRAAKPILQQQKTKKIEFQDTDHYLLQIKKQQQTKIRYPEQLYQNNDANLGLSSNQNSDSMDSRDLAIISHKILSNYNTAIAQIKQQMAMVRYQYIEAEKVDIKKMINRLEGEIRRLKIGFRGLSDSVGKNNSSNLSPSKMRTQEDSQNKHTLMRKRPQNSVCKLQSKLKKEKSTQIIVFNSDYGIEPKSINGENRVKQLQVLQQSYRCQQIRENKFTAKLQQLQKKYYTLRMNNLRKDQSLVRRTQANQGGSILKRSKLIKQKIIFLRNELKETKQFYSNKIKRLKNQNTILSNEIVYIDKQVEDIIKILKQFNKSSKKTTQNSSKQNILIFDDHHTMKYPVIVKNKTSHQPSNNINSANDVKSLQSLNSIKSVNSLSSKPSLGSLNSVKSAKVESYSNKLLQNHNPTKHRLKIATPHHLSPPSLGQIKQNSIFKKFNNKSITSRGDLTKKSSSLDIAIEQLQKKYSKHMQQNYHQDEYYR